MRHLMEMLVREGFCVSLTTATDERWTLTLIKYGFHMDLTFPSWGMTSVMSPENIIEAFETEYKNAQQSPTT
jgi:hypothetical protein